MKSKHDDAGNMDLWSDPWLILILVSTKTYPRYTSDSRVSRFHTSAIAVSCFYPDSDQHKRGKKTRCKRKSRGRSTRFCSLWITSPALYFPYPDFAVTTTRPSSDASNTGLSSTLGASSREIAISKSPPSNYPDFAVTTTRPNSDASNTGLSSR